MKMSLRDLRTVIRKCINEATKTEFFDSPSPDTASREQIASLKQHDLDTEEDDELPPHLREPVYSKEECYGPVPPTSENPYVQIDPFTNDYNDLPSSRTSTIR